MHFLLSDADSLTSAESLKSCCHHIAPLLAHMTKCFTENSWLTLSIKRKQKKYLAFCQETMLHDIRGFASSRWCYGVRQLLGKQEGGKGIHKTPTVKRPAPSPHSSVCHFLLFIPSSSDLSKCFQHLYVWGWLFPGVALWWRMYPDAAGTLTLCLLYSDSLNELGTFF